MAEQHEKALVPQIRFTGFTDPWEQRKLGEIAEVVGGGTPSTDIESYWDGDIDWYSPAELGDAVYADSSVRKITLSGYQSCSATMLPAGKTILFTSRAGIGNTAILRRSGCTNQGFQSLVINDETDVYFVYSMSGQIKKYAEQKASGSTFLEISGKALAAGRFAFPSLDEQRLIGAFFDRLDSLITLHQRKYDKLCVLKKSMLDKMFPKGGSLYPEIRFAGFTDPWEQRKLDEVASKRIEKNTNGIKETFTNSAEHGIVSQLDYFDHDITNDANIGNYSVVYPDDFVYNPRISTIAPCGPINRNKLGRNGVMSPLYTVFSVDDVINKLYLEHYFKTNRWHQFMFLEGNSGARSDRFSISDSTFFEMPIQCPVLEEQELIASFFDRLDTLITLHQRKYDGCANPLFLERRISCRKPSHQNRCSATTTPSG